MERHQFWWHENAKLILLPENYSIYHPLGITTNRQMQFLPNAHLQYDSFAENIWTPFLLTYRWLSVWRYKNCVTICYNSTIIEDDHNNAHTTTS